MQTSTSLLVAMVIIQLAPKQQRLAAGQITVPNSPNVAFCGCNGIINPVMNAAVVYVLVVSLIYQPSVLTHVVG